MTVRFNPAPNWPSPPTADFLPPPGWTPGDLPAPPRGWPYFQDDDPRAPSPMRSGPVIAGYEGDWTCVVAFGQTGGAHMYYNGTVLVILRKGVLERLVVGKGEKRVPARSISSMQLKPAGALVSGYMQIGMSGANETRSRFGRQSFDAAGDENTMLFTKAEQPQFERLRDRIEQDLAAGTQPVAAAPAIAAAPTQPDIIDQIRRLGELRDAGIVTAEEFEAKKAELLGRL